MKNIEECVLGVVEFNTLCGNLDAVTEENLLAQARVVQEEAVELFDAVHLKEGNTQILKECVDALVVIHGFAAMLQRAGFDVEGAWKAVNENNMTKFTSSYTDACYTKMGYESTEGDGFYVEQVGANLFCVKDKFHKVRKPIGYNKVSVAKFTPEGKED